MSNRDYREGRVKVSSEIKKAILDLMRQENDIGQKKQHPSKWYRDAVAKELSLASKNNPSLRSYEVAIGKLRNKFEITNPLDAEWHLGTLLQYPITPKGVAKIIAYKLKARVINADWVTIRIALWMDRLSELPLSIESLHFFAMNYAIQEEMRELIGDEYEFSTKTDDDFALRLLTEYPNELLVKEVEPLTAEQQEAVAKDLFESITPDRIKEVAGKIDKQKRKVKNERTHNTTSKG